MKLIVETKFEPGMAVWLVGHYSDVTSIPAGDYGLKRVEIMDVTITYKCGKCEVAYTVRGMGGNEEAAENNLFATVQEACEYIKEQEMPEEGK